MSRNKELISIFELAYEVGRLTEHVSRMSKVDPDGYQEYIAKCQPRIDDLAARLEIKKNDKRFTH